MVSRSGSRHKISAHANRVLIALLLLAFPAGPAGDIFDRRKLILTGPG
jgi:hypothetical protein